MHSTVIDFNGNSNIGLYMFVTDKFILLGNEVPEKHDDELLDVFKVPIHRITIAGTSLIGVFVAGDENKIIVPKIIFDDEQEHLKELGINFEVVDTKLTCLGNNILVTPEVVFLNPEYSDSQAKEIGAIFNRKHAKLKVADVGVIGSMLVLNKSTKRGLISNDIDEDELVELEKKLGFAISPTSVNMGSPFVASGLVCNCNGFAIGTQSGSAEVINADEGLGFLDD